MYTSSTGNPKGAPNRDPKRRAKARKRHPLADAVGQRTYELVREVWLVERWKGSIATKVEPYITVLVEGKKLSTPAGIPTHVQQIIHRCFAQACYEHEAEGLNGQKASWYEEAVKAAQARREGSS